MQEILRSLIQFLERISEMLQTIRMRFLMCMIIPNIRDVRWCFIRGLERDLTPDFMVKIRENIHTSFYARHIFSYQLRNIEDGTVIMYYTNVGSPWFKHLSEAEKVRLDSDNIERPDTK